jgi:hypothetical protein
MIAGLQLALNLTIAIGEAALEYQQRFVLNAVGMRWWFGALAHNTFDEGVVAIRVSLLS